MSAFPPPLEYSDSPHGVGYIPPKPLEERQHYGPQNIPAFDDYDLGVEYAKKVNKPAFVDFTGYTFEAGAAATSDAVGGGDSCFATTHVPFNLI